MSDTTSNLLCHYLAALLICILTIFSKWCALYTCVQVPEVRLESCVWRNSVWHGCVWRMSLPVGTGIRSWIPGFVSGSSAALAKPISEQLDNSGRHLCQSASTPTRRSGQRNEVPYTHAGVSVRMEGRRFILAKRRHRRCVVHARRDCWVRSAARAFAITAKMTASVEKITTCASSRR